MTLVPQAKRRSARPTAPIVAPGQSLFQPLEPRLFFSASSAFTLQSQIVQPTYVRFHKAGTATPAATAAATGFSPTQIKQAYGIDSITFTGGISGTGAAQTIGIIDAYNDPKIFSSSDATDYPTSDLYQFNSAMGLPQFAASSASGPTFTKLNESGGTSYPTTNKGWSSEIALDVEWAHAIAPQANIVLVEGSAASYDDLVGTAVPTAVAYGANVVSMSFGGDEFSGESAYDSDFSNSAVTYVASTGDDGAPGEYPADSPLVLAVGGTNLAINSDNSWNSESTWNNFTLIKGKYVGGATGGGASTQYSKPLFQSGVTSVTSSQRMIPDVAFDADPNSGVSIYDTENNTTANPWTQIGGTSLSSPCWAALIAIADQGRKANQMSELSTSTVHSTLYQLSSSDFHDVTSGNNKNPNTGASFSAGTGYDLTTGLGTPVANLLIPDLDGLPQIQALPATPSGVALSLASDSGMSSSDDITNVNTPTITGSAPANSTVTLYANLAVVGQGTTGSNGVFSVTTSALSDGSYAITAVASTTGGTSTPSGIVNVTIDTVAPTIGTLSFNPNATSMTVTVPFSENVSSVLGASSLSVSGIAGSSQAESFNTSTNTASFTFTAGYTNGVLPDGNYVATLPIANVTDVAGNHPAATTPLSFFILDGDANQDRAVNALDFNALATNYGLPNKQYANGDFNYDGTVNSSDFAVLAAKFGKTLAAADVPDDGETANASASTTLASAAVSASVFSDQSISQNLANDILA